MAKTKIYKNWRLFTVKPDTSGAVSMFTNKTGTDYVMYKEGRAPSNAGLLLQKITIERACGTTPAQLEKAVKGAVVIVKGQSGQERMLGMAKFICPELNPFTEEDAYVLDTPIYIEPGATYDVVIRWDEKNGLDAQANETADIVIRVDGVEVEPES